jgi:hypothetical protein
MTATLNRGLTINNARNMMSLALIMSSTMKYHFVARGNGCFAWSQGEISAWKLAHPGQQIPENSEQWDVSPINSVCPPVCTNLKLLGDIDVSDVEILTVGHPASLMYQKFSRILTLALVLSIGYNVARALFETDASGLDGHGNRQNGALRSECPRS